MGKAMLEELKELGLLSIDEFSTISDFKSYENFILNLYRRIPSIEVLAGIDYFPDFQTYRSWMKTYRGWRLGRITEESPFYKKSMYLDQIPINKLYDGVDNFLKEFKK